MIDDRPSELLLQALKALERAGAEIIFCDSVAHAFAEPVTLTLKALPQIPPCIFPKDRPRAAQWKVERRGRGRP